MTKKTAWVIDDDEYWRFSNTKFLEKADPQHQWEGMQIRTFESVDEALQATPLPDLIATDGDTKSTFNGVNLAEKMKGTGVGVVVISGDSDTQKNLDARGCVSARYMDKAKYDRGDLLELAKDAMESAKVEKRVGGASNFPGNSNKGIP